MYHIDQTIRPVIRSAVLSFLDLLGFSSVGVMMPQRILVVDDEEMLRALIVRALRDEGYDVIEAENGIVGLELARDSHPPPDLVITDNRMKGMSGPELADELRQLYPLVPILHLSGSHTRQQGRNTIFKPFSRSDLLQAVRSLLQQ